MVTLAEAKTFMRVTTSADDALITSLIDYISTAVETYTGRIFRQTTVTEEVLTFDYSSFDLQYRPSFDLAGIRRIAFLKNYPITEITSLTHDGTALTVDDDYILDPSTGAVAFYTSVGDAKNSLLVTYTAGYATADVPADLKMIVLQGIKELYQSSGAVSAGVTAVDSKKIGDFSVSYATGSESINSYLSMNELILKKYRVVNI